LEGTCCLEHSKSSIERTFTNKHSSDAFTKREAAAEELYIRQEEKAKYVYESAGNSHNPHTFSSPRCREKELTRADTLHRLLAIQEKLKQQRQHIDDLDKHMSVPPPHMIYIHPPHHTTRILPHIHTHTNTTTHFILNENIADTQTARM
jgi:hypothetical protein